MNKVCVYIGDELAAYGFGDGHPFGPDRQQAFWDYATQHSVQNLVAICPPKSVTEEQLHWFHTQEYIDKVKQLSAEGSGYLDPDTPVFPGIYEAACFVVGSTIDAIDKVMQTECEHAFVPIAGLHHARRDSSAGFCVFNDCGVAIEVLRRKYDIHRVAYVDIDAHHGDGVFYAFEDDPELIYADIHEDGRYLYPGTGFNDETGIGGAKGTKLNISMPMYADDKDFYHAWAKVETYIQQQKPEFILMQCGADSIKGDPITHMYYSENVHQYAARRLSSLAREFCQGRLVATGGGGYNRKNLARAWTGVVNGLLGELK